ncbi:MAG: proline-rich domain-containing protein [Candidatus Methylacidiphilaceae bacterium]
MNEFHEFLDTLKQPEYVHVLLHPIPVYGLATALAAYVTGLAFKSRATQVVALALIILTSASGWLVQHYGEEGVDRVETMVTQKQKAWLDVHEERGERTTWMLYGTAAISALTLVSSALFPKGLSFFSSATVLAGVASLLLGIWTSHAGGQIRHKEFYQGPPPEAEKKPRSQKISPRPPETGSPAQESPGLPVEPESPQQESSPPEDRPSQ